MDRNLQYVENRTEFEIIYTHKNRKTPADINWNLTTAER